MCIRDRDLVKETVQTDTKDNDFVLRLAIVLDGNQQVAVMCVEDPKLECKQLDPHADIKRAGPVATDAWTGALAAWKASAAGTGAPLVKYDLTAQDARY